MKRVLFIVLLLCLKISIADVVVKVEPTTVLMGESFRLTLSADSQAIGNPDFSVLEKDFTLLGSEKSTQYTLFNQQAHSFTEWSLLLTPKAIGTFTIPPITFGHEQSTPVTLKVEPTTTPNNPEKINDNAPNTSELVLLKTNIDVRAPYVNQQIIYSVKIFNRARLLDAHYTPPSVKNALFIPIGDGRRYQTTLNGERYAVEEIQYAIFPQKSGSFTITPPKFVGLIEDFNPQRITLTDAPISLTVKPMPPSYQGQHWLPAKKITLSQKINNENAPLKTGDALQRIITMKALGVPAQLLPTLNITQGNGYQAYSNKPEVHNQLMGADIIGASQFTITYVLNKAGTITLPPIQLTWFNVTTQRQETTTLSAQTLQVSKAAGTLTPNIAPTPLIVSDQNASKSIQSNRGIRPHRLALMGLIIIAFFALHRWRQWAKKPNKKALLGLLKKACLDNNALLTKTLLLEWASTETHPLANLNQFIEKTHSLELKQQLEQLNEWLYGPDTHQQWQGLPLWRALQTAQLTRVRPKKPKKISLPPINF